MKPRLLVAAAATLLALGCAAPVGLIDGAHGTVVWRDLEGGFWAIEMADGRQLDPHESLPASFRQDGLQVHVAAQELSGVACIHGAGIIVEVTEIRVR